LESIGATEFTIQAAALSFSFRVVRISGIRGVALYSDEASVGPRSPEDDSDMIVTLTAEAE